MIYHMLPKERWLAQPQTEPYAGDTLETEGFIHCTGELERLTWVANHFYQCTNGEYVILLIDETDLEAELKWEEADGHQFPHLYGPLNLDAVSAWVDFPRDANGAFLLPSIESN